MTPSRDITRLLEIMQALRTPNTGCPWDLEQTYETIAPYTIEEAYEVAEAIKNNDRDELREELGDLLLQVVYHAQIASEEAAFSFPDVVEAVTTKMIRRHPHVFGDATARSQGMAKGMWERIKAEERAEKELRRRQKGLPDKHPLYLDSVPSAFPALTEADKLQRKASKVGFDWGTAGPVLAKIREEIDELSEHVEATEPDRDKLEDELGDVLFAVANLARHLDISPEQALKRTNQKFRKRFAAIESGAKKEGRPLDDLSLDEMEAYWQAAKKR